MWKFDYTANAKLPKLAWLAEVIDDRDTVCVNHGAAVECRSQWCVEGVWEDEFSHGNFHKVENFFGSGIRAENENLIFSASVATIDRIFHVVHHGNLLVSNSLVQLLSRVGAELNPQHDYIEETFASGSGIHVYPNNFRVKHPDFQYICQEYHCNLLYSNGELVRQLRSKPRPISNFDAYYGLMQTALQKIDDNRRSSERQVPVGAYATTSAGYDSTATAVFAKKLGVSDCFTTEIYPHAGNRFQESGLAVAEAIGLNAHILGSDPNDFSEIEIYFLAACMDGTEIFYHDLVTYLAEHSEVSVLFTGYYGDVIWDGGDQLPKFSDDIRRKDVSGLNISEVRLVAGFINLALPFMFARNIDDIMTLSRSTEMRNWSVDKDYDRPIPRRIAEQAGVPRELFGISKKAQLQYYNRPCNEELARKFLRYLEQSVGIKPWQLKLIELAESLDYRWAGLVERLNVYVKLPNFALSWRGLLPGAKVNLRSLIFVWSVNSLAARSAPDGPSSSDHSAPSGG